MPQNRSQSREKHNPSNSSFPKMDVLFRNQKLTLEPEYRTAKTSGRPYLKFHCSAAFNRNGYNRSAEKSWQNVYITVTLFGDLADTFDAQGFSRGDVLSFVGQQSFSARQVKGDDESNIQLEITMNEDNPLIPLLGGDDGLPWVFVKSANPEYMQETQDPAPRQAPPPPPRPTGLPPARSRPALSPAAPPVDSEDDDVWF